VIDFKTHEIGADEAARVSKDYTIQARIYREASEIRSGATIALHFTGPNSFVEME
jgi:ATP-dependent exoDNAse (exonuclease V) beta subunit